MCFSYFPRWYMRCMVMRVSAFEGPDLGGPSTYLKHILLSPKNFFRASKVEEFSKNWAKSQVKFRNFEMNFWRNLTWDFAHFLLNSSTLEARKNFLGLKSICLRYLKGLPRSGPSNAPTLMTIQRIYHLGN